MDETRAALKRPVPSAVLSPPWRETGRDLALALSLANLCFLNAWAELLPSAIAEENLYYYKTLPARAHYWIVPLLVLALAALIFGLARGVRRSRWKGAPTFGEIALLLALLVPLNAARLEMGYSWGWVMMRLGEWGVAFFAAALLALWLLFHRHRPGALGRAAAVGLLFFAPFAALTLGQSLWTWLRYEASARALSDLPPAHLPPADPPSSLRLVVALFDEADYELLFEKRPADLSLPEIDRLARQSVLASRAVPPADNTMETVPSLLTGRALSRARAAGPSKLRLLPEPEGPWLDWKELPTLFSKAHAQGRRAGVVGWYHPYCRLFGGLLSSCYWEPYLYFPWQARPLTVMLAGDLRWPLGAVPFLQERLPEPWRLAPPWVRRQNQVMGATEMRQMHAERFERLLERASAAAADPSLELLYLHFPIPHMPYIYDRPRRALTHTGPSDYAANLALMDHALGAMRESMERAGLWRGAAFVLTSDHRWRNKPASRDRRVPFLVKLPAQERPLRYEKPLDTIVLFDLAGELLSGGLRRPEDLLAWFAAHPGGA